jgi:hypothetical protein
MRIAGADLLAAYLASGRSVQVAAELAGMTRRQAQNVMALAGFAELLAESRRLMRERLVARLADDLAGAVGPAAALEKIRHAS